MRSGTTTSAPVMLLLPTTGIYMYIPHTCGKCFVRCWTRSGKCFVCCWTRSSGVTVTVSLFKGVTHLWIRERPCDDRQPRPDRGHHCLSHSAALLVALQQLTVRLVHQQIVGCEGEPG